MNNEPFKPRSFAETITLICEYKGGDWLNKKEGKPNQSKIGSVAGMAQVTVGRWLSGDSTPTLTMIYKLAKAWKLTPGQVIGELPIPYLDGNKPIDQFQEELLDLTYELPDSVKKSFLGMLREFPSNPQKDQTL